MARTKMRGTLFREQVASAYDVTRPDGESPDEESTQAIGRVLLDESSASRAS
jgi:hypothetical protein